MSGFNSGGCIRGLPFLRLRLWGVWLIAHNGNSTTFTKTDSETIPTHIYATDRTGGERLPGFGKVRLPAGVESVRLVGTPGTITAQCRVDFRPCASRAHELESLLRLFSGVHDVVVEAQTLGSSHQGRVHVNSVAIDEIEVPQFVLQLFVEKYVTPRYRAWDWIRYSRFPTRSRRRRWTAQAHDRAAIANRRSFTFLRRPLSL